MLEYLRISASIANNVWSYLPGSMILWAQSQKSSVVVKLLKVFHFPNLFPLESFHLNSLGFSITMRRGTQWLQNSLHSLRLSKSSSWQKGWLMKLFCNCCCSRKLCGFLLPAVITYIMHMKVRNPNTSLKISLQLS